MQTLTLRDLVLRHNRKVMLALIVAAVALPAFLQAAIGYRLFFNQLIGPHEVTAAEIAAIPSLEADSRRWFRVASAGAVPLRISDVTVRKRSGVETGRDYYYYFALRSSPAVLVRAKEQTPAATYLAELQPIAAHVMPRLRDHHPELARQGQLAPFVLEATTQEAWTRQLGMVLLGVLPVAVLLLWLLRRIARQFNWQGARAVQALARFNKPVAEVVSLIDADLARADSASPLRALRMTPQWLIASKLSQFRILHVDEVVWICPTYQTSYFTIIPVGRSHQLRFWDRAGRMLVVNGRKAKVHAAGAAFLQRAPWVFAGFTDELNAAFWRRRKGLWERAAQPGGDPATGAKRDRAGLIKAVDERRAAMLAAARATPSAAPV